MAKVGIGVFLRNPVPGLAKTRLAREIGPVPAAAIYRECARAALGTAARIPDAAVHVFFSPAAARRRIIRLVKRWSPLFPGRFVPLGRGDLGGLIHRALAVMRGTGCERTIVIGSDAPTLPQGVLVSAARSLGRAECVLGPARDGGFYLLGTRGPRPELLRGIAWSSGRECAQVLANARRARMKTAVLPAWFDVDRRGDLHRLVRSRRCPPLLRRLARSSLARTGR